MKWMRQLHNSHQYDHHIDNIIHQYWGSLEGCFFMIQLPVGLIQTMASDTNEEIKRGAYTLNANNSVKFNLSLKVALDKQRDTPKDSLIQLGTYNLVVGVQTINGDNSSKEIGLAAHMSLRCSQIKNSMDLRVAQAHPPRLATYPHGRYEATGGDVTDLIVGDSYLLIDAFRNAETKKIEDGYVHIYLGLWLQHSLIGYPNNFIYYNQLYVNNIILDGVDESFQVIEGYGESMNKLGICSQMYHNGHSLVLIVTWMKLLDTVYKITGDISIYIDDGYYGYKNYTFELGKSMQMQYTISTTKDVDPSDICVQFIWSVNAFSVYGLIQKCPELSLSPSVIDEEVQCYRHPGGVLEFIKIYNRDHNFWDNIDNGHKKQIWFVIDPKFCGQIQILIKKVCVDDVSLYKFEIEPVNPRLPLPNLYCDIRVEPFGVHETGIMTNELYFDFDLKGDDYTKFYAREILLHGKIAPFEVQKQQPHWTIDKKTPVATAIEHPSIKVSQKNVDKRLTEMFKKTPTKELPFGYGVSLGLSEFKAVTTTISNVTPPSDTMEEKKFNDQHRLDLIGAGFIGAGVGTGVGTGVGIIQNEDNKVDDDEDDDDLDEYVICNRILYVSKYHTVYYCQ